MPRKQRDYAAEYARRMGRAGEGPDERERARGHRGPASFRDAVASAESVVIRGKESGQILAFVVDARGNERTYYLQRYPDELSPGDMNELEDLLDDRAVDYDISISP